MKNSHIQVNEGQLLCKLQLTDAIAEVREHKGYRWLATKKTEQSPLVFQSLINLNNPTELVLPYTRTMTLFLLWKQSSINLLNLGMGVGSIETSLEKHNISLTSVEQSKNITEIAKDYFHLPTKISLNIDTAEAFLDKTNQRFDVILCDIFNSQDHSSCVLKVDFYHKLKQQLNEDGVIFLNLLPKDAAQLQQILLLIRQVFNYVTLVEYPDHKNIVLIISIKKIPDKQQLLDFNAKHVQEQSFDFQNIITSMLYIPAKESQP
ncbi:hypothetical protein KO527_04845 [Pseudoalteromonas sp. C2R02]|uniref:spermine/spermidine synthase domain-containing protein n=1 Tax=Pseudoalteromonas sp. C2R02 TaxID=2841565 RepID=UPI001C093ED8|nr:hypothetical protein [Pseudoalteromonas sp. C2R02]MBU2968680.1 hypothetical protein [Pseudoalteromonas sp. C2R02]